MTILEFIVALLAPVSLLLVAVVCAIKKHKYEKSFLSFSISVIFFIILAAFLGALFLSGAN